MNQENSTRQVTLKNVRENPEVKIYLARADEYLGAVGYTEHGERHANLIASIGHNILGRLKFPERDAELCGIAGYLHDIGNVMGRTDHGTGSALIAHSILLGMRMPVDEVAQVMGAIGNHEEEKGEPISAIAAGLILADKSDVHRSRVRNPNMITFDIHDRVNFAAEKSFLRVNDSEKTITLELTIDTKISQVMEYFEIFLSRMIICKRAAKFLSCNFELVINQVRLL
jgi:metal-dependent HD superfamily phosphatase/phosphodiesterase